MKSSPITGDDITLDNENLFLPIFFFRKVLFIPVRYKCPIKFCSLKLDVFQILFFFGSLKLIFFSLNISSTTISSEEYIFSVF